MVTPIDLFRGPGILGVGATPMPETATDLSDKDWNDLIDADYDLLRDVAKATENVRGDGSKENIAAGLLANAGRADEVPEEHQGEIPDELLDGADDAQSDDSDEDSDDAGDGETVAVEEDFQPATEYEPSRDEAFIIEADPLQEWVNHIDSMVDEAKIHLTFDGLWVKAVDAANVGMVRAELSAEGFDSFDVSEEGVIGVSILRLKSVLDGADSGQLVHIGYDATTRNLNVRFGGHEFTIALIDVDAIRTEPDLPDLDLPAKVEIAAADLADAVKYADEITDHVGFEATQGTFVVSGEGDTDDYRGEFDGDVIEMVERPNDEVSSLFSLDYLKSVMKPYERTQTLTVRLGQEFPVEIRGDVQADDAVGESIYMIAPRIQSR